MKKILIFKNAEDRYKYCEIGIDKAKRKINEIMENIEDMEDDKTYMITIEEVENIE